MSLPCLLLQRWENTTGNLEWAPTLLRCGPIDDRLQAFPVESDQGEHFLWVPRECHFALRFLNRVIYCLWHASRPPLFSRALGRDIARVGEYTDRQLRSALFNEVLEYWYPPGTRLPTQEEPIPQREPFHSVHLAHFLVMMYNFDTPAPPLDAHKLRKVRKSATLDPLQFDWKVWARHKPANQILLGTFPSGENLQGDAHDAPSDEIDRDVWSRYASTLFEEWKEITRTGRPNVVEIQRANSPKSHPATVDFLGFFKSLAGETSMPQMDPGSYMLQLNRTQLLFIPWLHPAHHLNLRLGHVVQVCIRGDVGTGDISKSNIYSAGQALITTTIETLLVGHVNGLHKLPKYVTIKEVVPGYTLTGMRKPWEYGRGKKFCLGNTTLQPAEDKWVFRFVESS